MAVEIVIGALVAEAVKLAAKAIAKKTGEEAASAGFRLLGWMREKLTGRAKEAFEDLGKNPQSEENLIDLKKQLTKLLETEPNLIEELKALVPVAEQVAARQAMEQVGNDNTGVQTTSQHINVQITR